MVKFLDLQAITQEHAEEYKAAAERVIDSGWFLQGNETKRFEKHFAEYIGTTECVGTANGLDALRLIIRGYKELGVLAEGDEIIVPAHTYIATILAITDNGLIPVPVEPTPDNLEMDIDRVEANLSPRTKGVMTVHLYGRLAYNEALGDICRRHDLLLMEDCAQSHGCCWNGVKTGALGHAAAHSFYPGKNMGAFGDAGAVTTNDVELARMIRALGNYGSTQKYVFDYVGINSRLAELDAAVLDVKLRYLDGDNERRRKLADFYYTHLNNPVVRLPKRLPDEQNVFHLFPVLCEKRDELQAHLTECGVQTLIHYPIAPHEQRCYATERWNCPKLSLPLTESIHRQELSLPMSQVLTLAEAQIVVDAVNSFK